MVVTIPESVVPMNDENALQISQKEYYSQK